MSKRATSQSRARTVCIRTPSKGLRDMATRIGIDVGGTFTDLIMVDDESGRVTVGKGPSNPAAVDEAVRGVLAASAAPGSAARAEYFLHGTTVGLNALLERKGAKVGLLTTA